PHGEQRDRTRDPRRSAPGCPAPSCCNVQIRCDCRDSHARWPGRARRALTRKDPPSAAPTVSVVLSRERNCLYQCRPRPFHTYENTSGETFTPLLHYSILIDNALLPSRPFRFF